MTGASIKADFIVDPILNLTITDIKVPISATKTFFAAYICTIYLSFCMI